MSFLSHFTQPPAYLKFPVFALDISDRSFKYLKFKETPRGLRLDYFGAGALAENLVNSGVIANTAAVAEAIRRELSTKPHRHVALALPEEKGFVRTIRMPRISPDEVREAISLQLEEYIPLPAEDVSFAYHILPDGSSETMNVLIAAYPTSLITAYKETVEKAGLMLVSLEIESQAIARSVIPRAEEQGAVLVVDIGLTRTSFLFAQDGYTQLTSTMPLGGKTMHEAIIQALRVDEKEAERLKKEQGLSRTAEGQPVCDALLPLVDSVANEIKRRVEFWRGETAEGTPDKKARAVLNRTYLCGREANLIGLPQYLSSRLGIPVTIANVWTNAISDPSYIPDIEFRDSLGYATSVGLALGA